MFIRILKKILRFNFRLLGILPFKNILISEIANTSLEFMGYGYSCKKIGEEVNNCLNILEKKPNIFIDIGANNGDYTKELIRKYPDLECHLFEPSETNFIKLSKNFKQKNILINQKALSKSKKIAYLYSNSPGSALGSLSKRNLEEMNISFNYKEKVEVIRFDEYWRDLNSIIDMVKIDVEGHELDVLNGFGDLIYKTKLIQFEFGGTCIDTRIYFQDFWYFFLENNFEIYRISPRGPVLIKTYSENDELFVYTNYIAVNKLI